MWQLAFNPVTEGFDSLSGRFYNKEEVVDDLSLATTEEILNELEKRNECMLFACVSLHAHDKGLEVRDYRIHGDTLRAVGLATWASHRAFRDEDKLYDDD